MRGVWAGSAGASLAAALLASQAAAGQAVEPLANADGDSLGQVTTQYPARMLREDVEGRAVYRITVSPEGRVTQCVILESSGAPELDRETCRMMSETARFAAFVPEPGQPEERTFTGGVTFRIED